MEANGTLQKQTTVADPGYVDLRQKYDLKDYAVLSRELALHKIATASCLTDRVYWALILTSACGRDVREGCFVRDTETGRLVRDENKQLFPLRIKHLIQMLGLTPGHARIHVSRAIRKLKEQGCLEERDSEKIWYPVLDPKRLPAERQPVACSKIRYNLAYTFLPAFLRKTLETAETVSKDVANSATTIARLKTISEGYKKDLLELQNRYKQVAGNALFEECIIISEELEDIEEDKRGECVATSSTPEPEQPDSPPWEDSHEISVANTVGGSLPGDYAGPRGSSPRRDQGTPDREVGRSHRSSPEAAGDRDEISPGNRAIRVARPGVSELVVANPKTPELFEVFCFIMQGCGRPVSVVRMDACRRVFFQYPLETQQRIVDDATIRSQRKWDDPAFIPDPLKYLKSQVWDIEPITARKFAPARPPTQKEKAEAAMKAHLERVWARDEGGAS